MRISRVYVADEIEVGKKISLDAETSKYLLNVLRLHPEDKVILFNGKKGEFLSKISAIENRRAIILIESFTPKNVESPLKIHLGQGISRGEKMDYTIQKAVELGVYSITPLFTQYCNIHLNAERINAKVQHWQKIAIHACEQSGRCYVPKILPPLNLSDWLAASNGVKFVFDPVAEFGFNDIKSALINLEAITIIVGPEGGLSETEVNLALANNFLAVKLGPRILRTETAAIVAVSVIQSICGDLQ